MISHIELSGSGLTIEKDTERYIAKKISRLERFLPWRARRKARAEVHLRQSGAKTGGNYACEVVLHVPDSTLVAREATLNIRAAIDIIEAKMQAQIKKYKEERLAQKRHRHQGRKVFGLWRRNNQEGQE